MSFVLTPAEFNDAWCAMCPVSAANFQDIRALKNNPDFTVFFHSNTNSFQYRHIAAQLEANEAGFVLPESNLCLSFRVGKQHADLLVEVQRAIAQLAEKPAAVVYISGDPKQVQNPIFRQVAQERTEKNTAFINEQDGSYHFVRDKKAHPSSSEFVGECVEKVQELLVQKARVALR